MALDPLPFLSFPYSITNITAFCKCSYLNWRMRRNVKEDETMSNHKNSKRMEGYVQTTGCTFWCRIWGKKEIHKFSDNKIKEINYLDDNKIVMEFPTMIIVPGLHWFQLWKVHNMHWLVYMIMFFTLGIQCWNYIQVSEYILTSYYANIWFRCYSGEGRKRRRGLRGREAVRHSVYQCWS